MLFPGHPWTSAARSGLCNYTVVIELQLEPGCDPCPPNPRPAGFDGDGMLTVFGFLAFQNAFVRGRP